MTRIVRAGDVIGMPVVTLDEATIVGEVRDVLFDPGEARVAGFTLRGRGLLSPPLLGLLPGADVRALGQDAVMIESESAVIRDKQRIREHVPKKREAPGSEVVTDDGEPVGTVSDIVLEIGDDGMTVVGYCIERDDGRELIVPTLEAPREWSDVIVVPPGIEERAAEGLVGFSLLLERSREMRSGAGL